MDNNKPKNTTPKKLSLDMTAYLFLLAAIFLLPFFFIPFFSLSIDISKAALLYGAVIVSFFLWLVARLKDGRFVFPKSIVLLAGGGVAAATLLSAFFSDSTAKSLIGLGYETGTFASVLVLFLLLFLSSIYFQGRSRVIYVYGALLISAAIVFLYQVVRFAVLSFGLPLADFFLRFPPNIVGKWSDLSIIFGLTTLLSLVLLEFGDISKMARRLLYGMVGISLFALVLTNFQLTWIVVGIMSLLIFVYSISFGRNSTIVSGERRIPAIPFIVLVVSLFFVLSGNLVNEAIYSIARIPQEVVRPDWSSTIEVARVSLAENPIFGAGPDRFLTQWLRIKDLAINNSPIWNIDFDFGVGLIPTMMINTGVVGVVAWALFLAAFLYRGILSVFLLKVNAAQNYTIVASFFAALYLWIFSFFYVPNVVIFALAFVMTGVFLAALAQSHIIKNYNFSFLDDPRVGFASVLVLILLVISTIAGGYVVLQRYAALGYFQKATVALRVLGDVDTAERAIVRAIGLSREDVYYRFLAEVNLQKVGRLLAQKGISKETLKTQFQSYTQAAIKNAIAATDRDPADYRNWKALAEVYQSLIPFGVPKEFYQSAKQAYERAIKYNPNSPALTLALARLELSVGNKDAAKEYITQALKQKNNYTEAIFLLAQMQADEGNLKDAIASAEVATLVAPNDVGSFFRLGLLRYNAKDYAGAAAAFGRAVELNPSYANAKYFLGLSLYYMGDTQGAIEQFSGVLRLNPGNKEIAGILANLKAGRAPFADGAAKQPEERDSLPIEE